MRAPGNVLLITDEVSWRRVITNLSGGVDEPFIGKTKNIMFLEKNT
jgi:hypothetical protein